jgi:type I restriction enzyme S subunit
MEKTKSGISDSGLNLKQDIFLKMSIPLPPLNEQNQIVQEIESRLSVCDKMEQSISESLEKAKALRQSILKKAFEGRLLSEAEVKACKQEADYEPASVLLEKIKAEKLAKEQEAKKTKKKSRK